MPSPSSILLNLTLSYPVLQPVADNIFQAFARISAALRAGGALYTCGNGGSAADAEHIAGELMKSFILPRPLAPGIKEALAALGPDGAYLAARLQGGLRCMALTGHPSLSTAMANDVAADLVFAQQVCALGRQGDVLLGISTSGNARNVLLAAGVARALDMSVIGLTGESGGLLKGRCDIHIGVAGTETYRIQELHLPVYHALCAMIEAEFYGVPCNQK